MPDLNNQEQFNSVYTLAIQPGIKRDGTVFETEEFTDGVWCRFQRGVAKKMGGYRETFSSFTGVYRGMFAQPYNGVNYVFAGNANGLDVFGTGSTYGSGAGPFTGTMLNGTVSATVTTNTTTTITVTGNAVSAFPNGTQIIFSQSGTPTTYTVSGTPNYTSPSTVITFTPALGSGVTVTEVWKKGTVFSSDTRNDWQFDAIFSPLGGNLQLLAHPGLNLNSIDNAVKSQVLVGNVVPSTGDSWSFSGLSDSAGPNPTFQPISVDGGVCVLYPFIFVYGSNGFIANNNISTTYDLQNLYDWNGPLANQTNVASSKIVKGMPMRGGTNSPSGLFWATDSLIRVSFNAAAAPNYWSYDIISSQISIMSSNAVAEMDGVYFWMGVDRFYLYNGNVQVLPNDKNVNYLFDNINYQQRQKVWATKVPRFNEIWFFYPRGNVTECNDAIIYNVKDKLWYDAGMAVGSQRSCGYTTEVFPTPIWADWNYVPIFSAPKYTIATPTGQPAAGTNQFYVSGDLTPEFSPGSYMSLGKTNIDPTYLITASKNVYNTTIGAPGVTLVTVSQDFPVTVATGSPVYLATGGYRIWQHEFGQNAVSFTGEQAVYSSITTSDIGWLTGTPSGQALQGANRRMHLRRFEPNFLQTGTMTMTILGRKFAGGTDMEESGPYYFDQNTGKIDLRVEYRLIRLKFESNELDGNYEMGRNIITCEYGDERP